MQDKKKFDRAKNAKVKNDRTNLSMKLNEIRNAMIGKYENIW